MDQPPTVASASARSDAPGAGSGRPRCTRCGKTFSTISNLRRHRAQKTACKPPGTKPGASPPVICQYCGAQFARPWCLARHQAKGQCTALNPPKQQPSDPKDAELEALRARVAELEALRARVAELEASGRVARPPQRG